MSGYPVLVRAHVSVAITAMSGSFPVANIAVDIELKSIEVIGVDKLIRDVETPVVKSIVKMFPLANPKARRVFRVLNLTTLI